MATVIQKTVKASGGDYSSLAAGEAGEQGNFVSLDQIHRLLISAFIDTTQVVFDGSTTSATQYWEIITEEVARHAGVWDTNAYILRMGSAVNALTINDDWVRVTGLQIERTTGASGDGVNIDVLTSGTIVTWVDRCLIRQNGGTSGVGFHGRAGAAILSNSVIYGGWGDGIISRNPTRQTYPYNVTIHGCTATGMTSTNTGTFICRNCVSFGNTGSDYWNDAGSPRHYCVSEDASAGTSNNSRINLVFDATVFVNIAGGDFHLVPTDALLKNLGHVLSTNPDAIADFDTFDWDIDGDPRIVLWDIGADENYIIDPADALGTRDEFAITQRQG